MKKYGKLIAFTVLAYFISAVPTFAKLYTVDEFGEKAEEIADKEDGYANYAYIIGDYAFTSVHTLTVPDIMLAARSIELGEGKELETDKSNGYGDMAIYYLVNTGKGWKLESNQVGSSKLDDKFNVDYVDYIGVITDYIKDEVNPEIQRAVDELNEAAAANGFKSIEFDKETKTVTFNIQDLSRFLKDYANAGEGEQNVVTLFKAVANNLTLQKITYTGRKSDSGSETETKEVNKSDLNDANIIKYAKDVLEVMTGKNATEILNARYVDVVDKEAKATFTFLWDEKEVTAEYTIKFAYDENAQEENLQAAATQLNEKAKDYGFSSIEYEDKTLTFTIQDESELLSKFAGSGILDLFEKYIAGATKAEYKISKGENQEETVTKDFSTYPTQKDAIDFAKTLLEKLAGKESGTAATLKLIDVANKEVTVAVTYKIGNTEETVNYTLKFVYDIEKAKDEQLGDDAVKLTEEILKSEKEYGFDHITYDKETKTIDFNVSNEGAKLVDFVDSGIIDLFKTFVAGASKVEYTVNGTTGESQKYIETFTGTLTDSDIKKFAARLLMRMAGKTADNNDSNLATEAVKLTVAEIAGKTASATFTFGSGEGAKTITYNLNFVYDVEEVKDAELSTFADALNATLAHPENDTKYGFDSIEYDETNHKVTFQASKDSNDVTLITFAGTGIIDMFQTFITNATKVEYKINGKTTTVEFKDLAEGETVEKKIMELAANLLLEMAEKTPSESDDSQKWAEAAKLTVKDIVGKTAEATFTYQEGDKTTPITFNLEFKAAATE